MIEERIDGGEEPLDLSPLERLSGSGELDRFVRRTMGAATAELARRQATLTLGGLLVRWRRPILAAAGLITVVSITVLLTVRSPSEGGRGTLTEALGVPRTWAVWVRAGEQPTPGQLLQTEESLP
jgi:hypothetical protein